MPRPISRREAGRRGGRAGTGAAKRRTGRSLANLTPEGRTLGVRARRVQATIRALARCETDVDRAETTLRLALRWGRDVVDDAVHQGSRA